MDDDELVDRVVNVILQHGFKSWKVYDFEIQRWYCVWNTTEVYEIWNAVDSSDVKYELIGDIKIKVREGLKKELQDLVEKYGLILDSDRIDLLLEKAVEEREGIMKLNC